MSGGPRAAANPPPACSDCGGALIDAGDTWSCLGACGGYPKKAVIQEYILVQRGLGGVGWLGELIDGEPSPIGKVDNILADAAAGVAAGRLARELAGYNPGHGDFREAARRLLEAMDAVRGRGDDAA